MLLLLLVAGVAPSSPARCEELLPSARILLRNAEHFGELDAVERFALATQLSDSLSTAKALEDRSYPEHLQAWARARISVNAGDLESSLEDFERASRLWPKDSHREAHLVRLVFDRQRVSAAVRAGRLNLALRFAEDLRADEDDPVILAWLAVANHRRGTTDDAALVEALDRSWRRASRAERHDQVFLRRSTSHLLLGEWAEAARAWIDMTKRSTRPRERAAALAFWDANPKLGLLVDQPEFAVDVGRWLARNLRRPAALEILEQRCVMDPHDGDAFAAVAEQLYRLRKQPELLSWLAKEWPSGLNDEQRAELDALPLGASRRLGASLELARAFETVARDYPESRRSVEALWEAGWMYELEGDLDNAQRVYDEYVARSPKARYGKDAALRGLLVRYRSGMGLQGLEERFEEIEPALGDDAARAGALWLLRLRALAEGETVAQLAYEEALAAMDTPVPLWATPRVSGDGEEVAQPKLLVRRQRRAFERIRAWLESSSQSGSTRVDPRVRDAGELLRLGLVEEGELELLSMVREDASDTSRLLDIARTAWRYGSPEVQARVAFLLRKRLRDDGPELEKDLWVISRPTPFYDAVREAADAFDLSPSILWAIMRRESFYDPDVVSIAGAHGLVQLMPTTAAEIVEAEGWDAVRPKDLLQPRTSLRLGAQHLRERLDDFGGSAFLALAAYNAGPIMARRWAERVPPGAPAPFASLLISYSETRAYVYDVLRNTAIYAQIAADSPPD